MLWPLIIKGKIITNNMVSSKLTYGQSNFFVVGGHVVLCCVMYSVEYLSLEMFRNNDN